MPDLDTSFRFGKGVHPFKECGMGPWLVLVSSCFRENVVCHMQNWVFFV